MVPLSSSKSALLFAPIWNVLAPFSPFTLTTCTGCCAGGAGCWNPAYGLMNGF